RDPAIAPELACGILQRANEIASRCSHDSRFGETGIGEWFVPVAEPADPLVAGSAAAGFAGQVGPPGTLELSLSGVGLVQHVDRVVYDSSLQRRCRRRPRKSWNSQ